MNIGIDISPISGGHAFRGVGSYTKSLTDALQEYEKGHTYTLFSDGKISTGVDIVHYPYFDPFFLTLPSHSSIPTVVTCHDLIPLVYPDKFPSGVRGAVKWQIQKRNLQHVTHVITDSYASKSDIVRITAIPEKNISVVYLAPAREFAPVSDKNTMGDYILYVGDVNWNKNVPTLIHAFAQLRESYPHMKLVLVGKAFLDERIPESQEISRVINKYHLANAVIKTGRVENDELRALYTHASVYVQPSMAEGFGFPVLEAMACGAVVVSTFTSSLQEIIGPAIATGIDADSMRDGMVKGLTLDRGKQAKIQKIWVSQFTWQRAAKETVRVYEKVLAKK